MRNGRKTKWVLVLPSIIILMVVTYQFWLPGWTITRLAEIAGSIKLGRSTDMKLFQAEGNGCYSVQDLTVYNKEPYSHRPFFSFKNIFFTQHKNKDGKQCLSSVECCNGDIYIIAFADGSTDAMFLPINFNGKVSLCNVRLHVNTPINDPLDELVLSLNGSVDISSCNDGNRKINGIDMKVRNSSGDILATLVSNPENVEGQATGNSYPFIIKGFDLAKLMTLKESASIMRYYPVIQRLMNTYNSGE